MTYYYPQAGVTLRIIWEDFGNKDNKRLQEVYSLPILTRRLNVNINDYTQADTFSCEIDYKQFPFDPRAIRACGITIHLQDMKSIFKPGGGLSELKPSRENIIFSGFADEESISFDDTSRVVKLEGRDLTALLIDRPWLEGPPDLSRPLDVILTQILAGLKETEKLKLDNRVQETLPTLGKYANSFSEMAQKKNTRHQESYWDVIQDLVGRAGLIAYVEIDRLVISKPRVLYNKNKAYQFVYGRNLKNLEYKRKLGRKKNFNIMVRSLDVESKLVLEAEIPLEATDEWAKEMSLKKGRIKIPKLASDGSKVTEEQDAPIISFRVPNISNKDQLVRIGQELYEELGRQQIEGSFSTRDMETIDGDQNCFNLLKLRNGDPLRIVIDQGDMQGLANVHSVDKKVAFLIERSYAPSVAQILAETLTNPRFSSPFYTRSISFTLDADNGFDMKIDFINFIETSKKLGGTD